MTITYVQVTDVQRAFERTEEFALIDVRREGDFATGHILFANNLPLSHIELDLERLVPRRGTRLILCDAGDGIAAVAADVIIQLGYRDVSVLHGGIMKWRSSGYHLFSGVNVPSKAFGEFIEHIADTPSIEPVALAGMIDESRDIAILDARPQNEFHVMNVPGAINCPGAELVYRFFENVPSPETLVIVNCAGRTRSIIGAQSLIDSGVPNRVVALRDGTMGWQLAGFELERGQSRHARSPDASALLSAQDQARRISLRAQLRTTSWSEYFDARSDESRTTYLFDVRSPAEFRLSHPQSAISAPGGQLVQSFDKFVAVRNATIFLCDSDGVRANMTAFWLKQMGWSDIRVIEGGIAGASLVSESEAPTQISPHSISPAEAAKLTSQGLAVVFDLADSKEYRRRHIRNARFCERADLPKVIGSLAPKLTALVTSPDGRLAAISAEALGILRPRLRTILGGTNAWTKAGLPMDTGRGTLPKRPMDVFYRPYDTDEQVEQAMRQYLSWEVGLLAELKGELGVRFCRL